METCVETCIFCITKYINTSVVLLVEFLVKVLTTLLCVLFSPPRLNTQIISNIIRPKEPDYNNIKGFNPRRSQSLGNYYITEKFKGETFPSILLFFMGRSFTKGRQP